MGKMIFVAGGGIARLSADIYARKAGYIIYNCRKCQRLQ